MNILDKYKVIKKIGSGGQGSVFLVERRNKKYALKIEKILERDAKKNLSSVYWREIEFISNLINKSPIFFTKLYDHEIIDNCNFMLDNPYNIDTIEKMNKSNYCSIKVYEFIDTTLDKIINKIKLPEIYSILIQLSYTIYIMNKNGYTHNDLHIFNIGVKNTKQKYITIFDKKIPTYGRIIKLIDYGAILHNKYTLHKNKLLGIHESKLLSENLIKEIRRILDIVFELSFYDEIPIKFWEKWNNDKELNNFLNSEESILVNNLVQNNNDKYNLFMILYPERAQKMMLKSQFKKTINNIIRVPIEDIIFLLNATHINDYTDIKIIILYLINKLLITI
jgi:hypothetical protein